MGSAMAHNCLKAGHEVTVYNRTAAKCEPLRAAGAVPAATAAEAASGREAVLLCVADTPDVAEVLFGPSGVIHALPERASDPRVLVIDHSTISAEATARFAERLERERGVDYLDAPVSGGDAGARDGTLSIMVGGRAEAFARAVPLLQAMGKVITHIGPRHGDGQRAKMINQLVVAINCLATTEAMRLGEALGLDMDKVLAAIGSGAAGSWSLSNLGPRWLRREFQPGFRLRHLLKDARLFDEAIGALGAQTAATYPGARLALDLLRRSVEAGNGDLNINAMEKIFLKAPR
jgi:3-hydroxyisobutyrate dehydrogenase